uniref:Protein E7 n=1 Tax=Human papillomavirus TaxID=10566 RepID=A0A385PJS6_9PAPI|nr:MAG: E7 protein [Human papillomavirus]
MIGKEPCVGDVELDLTELVLPNNLLCEESTESLSPDCEPEEEQSGTAYKVDTNCHFCGASVRLCVVASIPAIHLFEELLLGSFSLICPRCARGPCQHGRST